MARKIARAEELFDTLNDIEGEGEYTTLCYLMGVSINNDYMEKRKNPLTNRMKNYPNFERIASETNTMGLSGFILLARYRLHWKSKKGMDKSYWDEYVPNANKIRTSFGLDPIKKQEKVSHTTMQYGSGVVVGNTDNTQGRVYSMQNGATAEKDYHYYGVTSDGEIIREFSKDEIKKYLKFQAREVDGMSALKKLTQDQAILDDYTAQMKALKFAYKKFEGDHILYAVGTSKMGGQFYFINDNLIDNVSDVYVKPYRLRELARQKCKEDYGIIAESVKKYKNIIKESMNRIRLTEAQLHRVIKESVMRILSEGGMYGDKLSDKEREDKEREERIAAAAKEYCNGEVVRPQLHISKPGEKKWGDGSGRFTNRDRKRLAATAKKLGLDVFKK